MLWGQNCLFAPTENQQVLNEEYLLTQEQNIKLASSTCFKEFCDWRQKEIRRENVSFDYYFFNMTVNSFKIILNEFIFLFGNISYYF